MRAVLPSRDSRDVAELLARVREELERVEARAGARALSDPPALELLERTLARACARYPFWGGIAARVSEHAAWTWVVRVAWFGERIAVHAARESARRARYGRGPEAWLLSRREALRLARPDLVRALCARRVARAAAQRQLELPQLPAAEWRVVAAWRHALVLEPVGVPVSPGSQIAVTRLGTFRLGWSSSIRSLEELAVRLAAATGVAAERWREWLRTGASISEEIEAELVLAALARGGGAWWGGALC